MLQNWRTSLIGAIPIVVGVYLLYIGKTAEGIAAITAGVGLLKAADAANVG